VDTNSAARRRSRVTADGSAGSTHAALGLIETPTIRTLPLGPAEPPARASMLRLACANTNQRRQWQPLPWHCYSAAGVPADTKQPRGSRHDATTGVIEMSPPLHSCASEGVRVESARRCPPTQATRSPAGANWPSRCRVATRMPAWLVSRRTQKSQATLARTATLPLLRGVEGMTP